ncbi:MAG: hypothetical protein FD129_3191 [bacterium]|nr:MAG: hypothetical protein FD129_3191 [bacterium]
MKIFLGNPPWYRENLYFVRAGSRWPHFEDKSGTYMPFPFYMAYAATMLTDAGHTVAVCDGVAEGLEQDDYIRRAQEFQPDFVFSETSTPSLEEDLGVVSRMRQVVPGALYGMAGMHAPMFRPDFLDQTPTIDVSFVGEYETTLVDLANTMEQGSTDFTGIRGLVCRAPDGTGVATGRRTASSAATTTPGPRGTCFPWTATTTSRVTSPSRRPRSGAREDARTTATSASGRR